MVSSILLKTRVNKIYDRYRHTAQTPDGPRKVPKVIVPSEGRRPLVAQWGGIPLKWRASAVLDHMWAEGCASDGGRRSGGHRGAMTP